MVIVMFFAGLFSYAIMRMLVPVLLTLTETAWPPPAVERGQARSR
ncbi:MAG: hypothetical protein RRC34_11590 [Lentisphaeria bacterium]|nr:hypothetical protein [Lentisphaeria bacterium]